MLWDVFCRVIDNFGDVGVCWRLCAELAQRQQQVRLWIDDASALDWMAPGARQGLWAGIKVYPWTDCSNLQTIGQMPHSNVWVEGFGCEIAPEFIAAYAQPVDPRGNILSSTPVWINLEYLSAEAYVETCHGLPSPVMHGPGKGLQKYFFYPGFNARTGGLLREIGIEDQQCQWDTAQRAEWLKRHGVTWRGERCVSLFCYEPPALVTLLRTLAQAPEPTLLLATAGRAQAAINAAWKFLDWPSSPEVATRNEKKYVNLTVCNLPMLTQQDFDRLLWTCDLNFVRGEDSLVRALWAGKPFVWQIYPQDDGAHLEKLTAFLDEIEAPEFVREAHWHWNLTNPPQGSTAHKQILQLTALPAWLDFSRNLRSRLSVLPDLSTQLIQFVEKKR